jgi:hypothetical protein
MKSFIGLVKSAIGAREAMLLAGLGLVSYGAAGVYPPAAFFLPGAVLVFVAIAGLR